MHPITRLTEKESRLVIGLMSGTSADGIDAGLVRIHGHGLATSVEQLGFLELPYQDEVRGLILQAASGGWGGSHELCRLNVLLGELFTQACVQLCETCGVALEEIDLVGSHGQTIWHMPKPENCAGQMLTGTFQTGEAAVIAQRLGCIVVSDFRVRDMAAGGLGAPLVPYTEYLLYRREDRTIALQNIGGIGNITILPAGCRLEEVYAFDTGPGNMVMDALVERMTSGAMHYDEGGRLAASGQVNTALLTWMLQDDYLREPPPKTTGRERYGRAYVEGLVQWAAERGISPVDLLTTATCFTAECIRVGIQEFCSQKPQELIIGGGGSRNPTLLGLIREALPGCFVLTNEDLQMDSAAKEAVAFAVLANETLFAKPNNAPKATGAVQTVVMGKISL